MLNNFERFVVGTKQKKPDEEIKYIGDWTKEFYKKGMDFALDILDTYKWVDREDAYDFLKNSISKYCINGLNPDDFEVKTIRFVCEVI